jgi:hypothetical protein
MLDFNIKRRIYLSYRDIREKSAFLIFSFFGFAEECGKSQFKKVEKSYLPFY